MTIDDDRKDMTPDEVRAELDRRGIDTTDAVKRVLDALADSD